MCKAYCYPFMTNGSFDLTPVVFNGSLQNLYHYSGQVVNPISIITTRPKYKAVSPSFCNNPIWVSIQDLD